MLSIDKLCYHSRLRYCNPTQKVCYSIATILLCVGSQSIYIAMIVFMLNSYLLVRKSGISLSRFLYYLRIPMAFMILSTLSIIIHFTQTPLDAFAIPIGGIYITSSTGDLYFAVQLMLTAMAGVSCLYFMSFTTPMTDLLQVFHSMHLPNLFIELMMLIYRYIFILLELAHQIQLAQHARLGNKDYKTSLKSFAQLVSMLFIRAMKKANLQYDALESRGYDGKLRVLEESRPAKLTITILIILFELLLIFIWVLTKFQ